MKGDRGDMANGYAWLWYFESVQVREKYFNSEDNAKDEQLMDKMNALNGILVKYAIDPGMTSFTDWIVL